MSDSRRGVNAALTVVWVGILGSVAWKLAQYSSPVWGRIDQVSPMRLMAGIATGVAFTLPLAWVMYDYFCRMGRNMGRPVALVLTFLPAIGKYIPGRVWAASSYLYHARELAGLAIDEAALFLVYVQVVSILASVALAVLGMLLTVTPALTAQHGIGATIMVLACLVALLVSRQYERRFGRAADLRRLPRHLGALVLQKIARGGALALFVSAFVDIAGQFPLLVLSFVVATQIGVLAFFAPAGLGVQEGAFLLMLSGALGPEQAALIAVLARIWQIAIDLILAVAALGLKGRCVPQTVQSPERGRSTNMKVGNSQRQNR